MVTDLKKFTISTGNYFLITTISILLRMYLNNDINNEILLRFPLLIIFILLSGFFLLRAVNLKTDNNFQLFTLSMTTGITGIILAMFLLLSVHILNLFTLLFLFFLLVQYNFFYRKEKMIFANRKDSNLCFALISIIIIVLYSSPFEYIWGGTDASSYIFNAFNFLNKNSMVFHDEGVACFSSLFTPNNNPNYATLKYAGYYITDIAHGTITPQFFPAYPLLLALGILFIKYKFFYMNMLLLIIFSANLYLLFKLLFQNSTFSWMMAALVIVNLQIIWSARITHTEIFTAVSVILILYSLLEIADKKNIKYEPVFILGYFLLLITRVDLLFITIALMTIFVLYHKDFSHNIRLSFVISTILSYLIMFHYSSPYINDIYYYLFHMQAKYFYIYLSTALILFYLSANWKYGRYIIDRIISFTLKHKFILKILFAIIITGTFTFLYFYYPDAKYITYTKLQYRGKPLPTFNNENFYRLGWFFSPVGLLLFVSGFLAIIMKEKKATWFIIIIFFLPTFYYLYHLSNNPLQIYGFRRYIPGVMLFMYLSIGYAFFMLKKMNGIVFGIMYSMLFFITVFFSFSMAHSSYFKGATDSLHKFDDLKHADCIFVLKEHGVAHWQGPTLEYYMRHRIVIPISLKSLNPATIEKAKKNYDQIYIIGKHNAIKHAARLNIKKIKNIKIKLPILNQSYYGIRTDEGIYATNLSIYALK